MSEMPTSPENPSKFDAYSGTTRRNFQRNAYINNDGFVEFDKSRSPNHRFKNTFFATTLKGTFHFTAAVASEVDDVPVIMAGSIDKSHQRIGNLPAGTSFPVERLWVPKEGIDKNILLINMFDFGDAEEALANLVEVDPKSLLEVVKKE